MISLLLKWQYRAGAVEEQKAKQNKKNTNTKPQNCNVIGSEYWC